VSQLRHRLFIAQGGCLSSLLLLIALGVTFIGTAAAAELFEGTNAVLEIPAGSGGEPEEAESAIAELPTPREVPTDIAAELKRLQKQIDELQAARDAVSGGEKASLKAAVKEKASEKSGEKSENP